jgi:hypothetical protein
MASYVFVTSWNLVPASERPMSSSSSITTSISAHLLMRFAPLLLATSVFALALHAKLALYKTQTPSTILTLTKLSTGERPVVSVMRETRAELTDRELFSGIILLFALPAMLAHCCSKREDQIEDGLFCSAEKYSAILMNKAPPLSALRVLR